MLLLSQQRNIRYVASAFFGLWASSTFVMAQDPPKRPLFSDPIVAADPIAAIAEATQQSKAAHENMIAQFAQHDGPIETFVRTDPILQDVSWPYGNCLDMMSLVPPPLDGWGMRSGTLANETFDMTDTGFMIHYVTYAPTSVSTETEGLAKEESVSITINGAPDVATIFEMTWTNPDLRSISFVDGPYGYPVSRYDINSAVLGPYLVRVNGTGEDNPALYFQEIVRCAIDNGLVAKGLDPASFSTTP